MNFDHNTTKGNLSLHKYSYYLEKAVLYFAVTATSLGLLLVFWEGWVQGTALYNQASNTVDICEKGKNIMQKSSHLLITCSKAKEQMGRIPIIFAMQFVLKTTLDYMVYFVCQIGASWISTIVTSSILALMLGYVYHKISGTPNMYAMMLAAQYQHQRSCHSDMINNMIHGSPRKNTMSLKNEPHNETDFPIDYGIFSHQSKTSRIQKVE